MFIMSIIITTILLVCGYLSLVQMVNSVSRRSYYAVHNIFLIDIVLAILYLLVCGFVGLLYLYSGFDFFVVYAALALMVLIVLVLFLRYCWKNRWEMQRRQVVLFTVYFAFVLYLTVFMRIGSVNSSIVTTPFDDFAIAFKTGDTKMLEHMAWNVVLFIPFGYLIPAMNPQMLRKSSISFIGGLMCSTVIEGVQMVFSLGMCDIDDIIANTVGAMIGYGCIRFLWQVQKNWKL